MFKILQEGVIKFNISKIIKKEINIDISEIENIRYQLYQLNLIGYDKNLNLGFGNISKRVNKKGFIITASQTGNLSHLNKKEYTLIKNVNFKTNSVVCMGLKPPSSESLTHAAFYYNSYKYNAVIHIHNLKIWENLINKNYISTPEDALYGSKELWHSIIKILKNNLNSDVITIVIKGHKEGIFTAAISLDLALNEIIKIYNKTF